MADLAHEFIAALHAGRACLHPTDTLPGLTFDPSSPAGRRAVDEIKGRAEEKPFLALVCSLAKARRFFAPLPPAWDRALGELWPGPLSVVWQASPKAPAALVATDGTMGLRVPRLPVESAWFRAVLEGVGVPLPTTSVNRSGEPPARSFDDAAVRLTGHGNAFVPRWAGLPPTGEQPSTIVQLFADGRFKVLRQGALPLARLTGIAEEVV